MKKIIRTIIALTMALAITACAAPAAAPEAPAAPAAPETPAASVETPAAPEGGKTFRVGVIQLTQHAALDAACEGFVEGLKASGLNVEIDVQNAQGEQAICATIATKFVNDGVDLMLAIATPAAQAAAQATKDIPILFTAVTDPVSAGLVATNEAPGGNVSGTSDMNPVEQQVDLLLQLVPDATTVGIMYNSSEDNSIIQANLAKAALEAKGVAALEFTASASSEVQAVAQSAVGKVQAIYLPTDNLMADTVATISMVTNPAGIPLICGESNMVLAGGLATYGLSYKDLGLQTAAMAVKVLQGAAVSTLPVEYYSGSLELTINQEVADQLKITIPAELKN